MNRLRALESVALLASGLLALAACSQLAEKPVSPVDLTGQWRSNAAQSDDLPAMMAERRALEKSRLRRQRGDPSDPLTRMGLPNTVDSPDAWEREREFRERHDTEMNAWLWLDARTLEITQTGRDLVVASPDASTRYVYGQKSVVSTPRGIADRLAGWEGRVFVVRSRSPDGPTSEQRYELSPDRRQLIMTTQMGGSGPHLKVRRVFDRMP